MDRDYYTSWSNTRFVEKHEVVWYWSFLWHLLPSYKVIWREMHLSLRGDISIHQMRFRFQRRKESLEWPITEGSLNHWYHYGRSKKAWCVFPIFRFKKIAYSRTRRLFHILMFACCAISRLFINIPTYKYSYWSQTQYMKVQCT